MSSSGPTSNESIYRWCAAFPECKARPIKETNRELSIHEQQRRKLRQIIAAQGAQRVDRGHFELMIGAAVQRQVELRSFASEACSIVGGFSGYQYVMVQDRLIVVDQQSHRIVAIVPQMS